MKIEYRKLPLVENISEVLENIKTFNEELPDMELATIKISQPAHRALQGAGIETLEQWFWTQSIRNIKKYPC